MRFKTRCDTWLVVVLSGVALLMIAMPSTLYFTHAVRGAQMWMFLLGPSIMMFVLSVTLPQYYELRDEGLFIRQGRKRALLPYGELRELRAETSVLSAPVFSTHRIYVKAKSAGEWVIAVADEDEFLTQVRRRAPQIERGSMGSSA